MTTLLQVNDLVMEYPVHRDALGRVTKHFRAVDQVSFELERGQTLAIVGESGAGKSTVARLVMRLLTPTSGEIRFEGQDISTLPKAAVRSLRQHMQMIFQDPYSSLDPLMDIRDSVAEPLKVHTRLSRTEREQRAAELLQQVGIHPDVGARRPHELSGGQLQRVSIARALTVSPSLIVCDEPVAALDVSIRAQVINLLMDLQRQFGPSYLFISHDLALVRHIADHVAIMRAGVIVEAGPTARIFDDPQHEYTRELLGSRRRAIQLVDDDGEELLTSALELTVLGSDGNIDR
jgi:peptide/nickel transport system ATP-binding protein/oligopeptide transport system ATP-binding protein